MTTENKFLIYALQSPSGRLYVGQTKDYDRRMRDHQKEDSVCTAISRAIKKYKWENIKQFVLMEGLSVEQANHWEEHYIFIFDSFGNGYNLMSGGKNSLPSQITRDRMSASQLVAQNRPEFKARHKVVMKAVLARPEVKAKMSLASMGNQRALGMKHTAETRAKLAVSQLGKKHTAEFKANRTGQNNPMSATNIRRRFIAKCFDGGVFDLKVN